MGRDKREGGRVGKIVILCTSSSTQIPNHKTNKRKKDESKQHSKQAIRQGKLGKIAKCVLTRFYNSGRYILIHNLFQQTCLGFA